LYIIQKISVTIKAHLLKYYLLQCNNFHIIQKDYLSQLRQLYFRLLIKIYKILQLLTSLFTEITSILQIQKLLNAKLVKTWVG